MHEGEWVNICISGGGGGGGAVRTVESRTRPRTEVFHEYNFRENILKFMQENLESVESKVRGRDNVDHEHCQWGLLGRSTTLDFYKGSKMSLYIFIATK
jgi:hypothetical protein